jgi:prepilin-type N-terminal cleavage/methylation domain-containing protein
VREDIMTTNRYNRKGFTLAEAMIAVTLLAFAASAVSMPFVAGAACRAEGARRTLAAKLAHDRLEQIINTDYDQIFWMYEGWYEFAGFLDDGNGGFLAEPGDPTYSGFTRFSNVVPFRVSNGILEPVPFAEFADSDFSLVTVSVSYDEGSMYVRLSTLIGK